MRISPPLGVGRSLFVFAPQKVERLSPPAAEKSSSGLTEMTQQFSTISHHPPHLPIILSLLGSLALIMFLLASDYSDLYLDLLAFIIH